MPTSNQIKLDAKSSKSRNSALSSKKNLVNWPQFPLGKTAIDKRLLLEENILFSLNVDLKGSDNKSFSAFEGAKWMKDIRIIGCVNENISYKMHPQYWRILAQSNDWETKTGISGPEQVQNPFNFCDSKSETDDSWRRKQVFK